MQTKKDLGLEPADAEKPTRIIIPDKNMVKRLLTVAPIQELKTALKKMPTEQISEFANYAVASGDISLERSEIVKEIAATRGLNIDIAQSIKLNKLAEEPNKKNNKE